MTERTSYLTEADLASVQVLHKNAPYALMNVSQGQFSIARHFGGMTFNGCRYTYMDGHDECIRDDVLSLVQKLRKLKKKEAATNEKRPHQDVIDFKGTT